MIRRPLALLLLLVAWTGATADEGPERRFWPDRGAWRAALSATLRDPHTWGPAAGAALVAAADWDDNVSDWAARETPVFGSVERATDASDVLVVASHVGMVGTSFLADIDEEHPVAGRLEILAVEHGAWVTTRGLTGVLKNATGRVRPDESNDRSLPSGHASQAFSFAASSGWNLRASRLPRGRRLGLRALTTAVAGGCAWARVEAGSHFPSDVLAGAALGNFVTRLLDEAFLTPARAPLHLEISLERSAVVLRASWSLR